MVAPRTRRRFHNPAPAWHAAFLRMLPAIRRHARITFRHLDPERREEMIHEVVCSACCATARLAELGKLDLAYAGVLARYGVAQARDGRQVGNKLNVRDVLSPYCQQRKQVVVERLDRFDANDECWMEALVEDRRVGPAETAAARLDFASWLKSLSARRRKIATVLATGERTSKAAKIFRVSQGRISQLRGELAEAWRRFHGETPQAEVAPA